MNKLAIQSRRNMTKDILQDYFDSVKELATTNPDEFEHDDCRKMAKTSPKDLAKRYTISFKEYLDSVSSEIITSMHSEISTEAGTPII